MVKKRKIQKMGKMGQIEITDILKYISFLMLFFVMVLFIYVVINYNIDARDIESFCEENGMERYKINKHHQGCIGLVDGNVIYKESGIYQGERYFLE